MTDMLTPQEVEADETAWRWFAEAHPHEAAELDWPRFVAYFRRRTGREATEQEIQDLLKAT